MRRLSGVLVLDKPAGLSSNKALQRVKRFYAAAKAGHTGSLDPLATGVLPVCLGEATKFSRYLLDADKSYETTVVLGVTTETGDADGKQICRTSAHGVRLADVHAVLPRFHGRIMQVPPMYSALKQQGVPLYALARKGKVVQREARQIRIDVLEALEFVAGEQAWLRLRVDCSKGTYIRVLAEDIGSALGCGAHVAALRRTRSGPYSIAQAVSLEELEQLHAGSAGDEADGLLLSPESALGAMQRLCLPRDGCRLLAQGKAVEVLQSGSGLRAVFDDSEVFCGVAELGGNGILHPRRIMSGWVAEATRAG